MAIKFTSSPYKTYAEINYNIKQILNKLTMKELEELLTYLQDKYPDKIKEN
jgi:hypothetical protein